MKSKLMTTMACAGLLAGGLQSEAAIIPVNSDVTTSQTWLNSNTYVLGQPIFVRDGATLTIQAGTLIRGEKELTTDPGALIVSRGSKIMAMGTLAQPIVMTDLLDDHYVGPTPVAGTPPYSSQNNGITRRWGGLIVLGSAYIATNDGEPGTPSPNAGLERQIEGLTSFGTLSKYGGGNDDDDSGEIRYVSLRYGGFVLGDANEINGLTMGAVGRETVIENFEVFQNKDDGFEWFGSTVNTKYLVAWNVADDSFDWDEGYRGKGQFWFAVQGPLSSESDKSDKLLEMDGGDGDSSQPSSIPTVFNLTGVGHGKASGLLNNVPLHFRDGTGGRMYNSMMLDFGGACALIEGDPANATYEAADNTLNPYVKDAFYTHSNVVSALNRELEINRVMFWRMGTNVAISLPSGSGQAGIWGAESGDINKPHYGYPLFTSPQLKNAYRTSSTAPIKALTRSGTPVVGVNPVTSIDPTIADSLISSLIAGGLNPPADGFFSPVRFVGAFGKINWAAPWTLAYRQGTLWSKYQAGGPVAVATANNSESNIVITVAQSVTFRGQMIAEMYAGANVEWWIAINHVTAGNWSWYDHLPTPGWTYSVANPSAAHTSKLQDVISFNAVTLSGAALGVGTHTFYFGADTVVNNAIDGVQYLDTVTVTVTP